MTDHHHSYRDYHITAPLGAGSGGDVHLARHRDSGQICALKRARPGSAGADALAVGLRHPNIVGLHDVGGGPVVMEYVAGPDLRRVLVAGPPPLAQTLQWMGQLLAALACLHAHGLVHRDVKPANLLLGPDGALKLIDFGLAHRVGGLLVQDSSGTPNYMAPEQMRGRPLDQRCDLYAAGVVLYEMLTGRRPHSGTAFEVMQQALRGRHKPPSAVCPALGRRYDALLDAALAPDPGRRPADALEFHTVLKDAHSAQL